MTLTLISIEVWRDSGASAVVSVYQNSRRIDRVTVLPGDCLDLELGDGLHAMVGEMPRDEEIAADFAAQDALQALEAAS